MAEEKRSPSRTLGLTARGGDGKVWDRRKLSATLEEGLRSRRGSEKDADSSDHEGG